MTQVYGRYFISRMHELQTEVDTALRTGGISQLTHAQVSDYLRAATRAYRDAQHMQYAKNAGRSQ